MTFDSEETIRAKTIGRYQILDELGRGAMGVVHRGYDPLIGRTVALKMMLIGLGGPEAKTLRERLYREAAAAGALSHPNIVTIFDIVESGGATAVAMEFIEGTDLATIIGQRGPLPLDTALDLFEQMCAGLDYAGSRGVVHRDIKPANILITGDGRVKVTDFGVARLALSTLTQAGTVLGSPSYMSPEQVRGNPVDGRSDLFSAAVVFYEMITRERPFGGDDVATTMYRIAHEPPTPPGQFNSLVSPEITAVIERALQKNPDDRYQRGAELIVDLRLAVAHANVPASPPIYVLLEGLLPAPSSQSGTHGDQNAPATASSSREHSGGIPVSTAPSARSTPDAAPTTVQTDRNLVAAADVTVPAMSSGPVAPIRPAASPGEALPVTPVPGPASARTAAKSPGDRSVRGFLLGFVGAAAVLALLVAGFFFVRARQNAATVDPSRPGPAGTPADSAPAGAAATAAAPAPAATDGGQRPADAAATRADSAAAAAAPQASGKSGRGATIVQPGANRPLPGSKDREKGTVPPAVQHETVPPPPPAGPPPTPPPVVPPAGPIYESNAVDVRPVTIQQVEPVYPPEAIAKQLEDVVVLRLLVTATGQVADVQVLRKSQKDPAFDGAAVAAARQWLFRPATRRGQPVACWFNAGVSFKLPK